jgi:hypothetical protein
LADPDLILGSTMWTLAANRSGNAVWSANAITGTSPAQDLDAPEAIETSRP